MEKKLQWNNFPFQEGQGEFFPRPRSRGVTGTFPCPPSPARSARLAVTRGAGRCWCVHSPLPELFPALVQTHTS